MNILACKMYTVRDHSTWFCDRRGDLNLDSNYRSMRELMIESASEYCVGLDQIITHSGTVDSIQDAFKNHLSECYLLWCQGHTVLSVDLDVVFTAPHNWFKDTVFRMYAHTDPKKLNQFEHYLNCGVKLFPSDLPEQFWQDLFAEFENWNHSVYDHEQRVLNKLFWSQNHPDLLSLVDHKLAYQWLGSPSENLQHNGFEDWTQAKCVHVHGSRGSRHRLELMQYIRNTSCKENSTKIATAL